jgi:hypothetical protein
MEIASRYADIPEVILDHANVPERFRHLIPLAKEWSIGDDIELESFIEAASDATKKQFVDAFAPHFEALWEWHQQCANLVPQPDELILFDIAANAANEVQSRL